MSAASSLFHCNAVEKKEYPAFLRIGRLLKDLSGIDYKNWGALPLAAAFNIILTHKINDFDEVNRIYSLWPQINQFLESVRVKLS